ncbi:MAG: hypothetical protein D6702_01590 [Planctomycetota bacterium]|nr:MAG: hypothetical protein D6702_01590 [Planctomycetota bacterium]
MSALEGLLQLCDRIGELQARNAGPDAEAAASTRAEVREIRSRFFAELPSLRRHPAAGSLDDAELLLLALLFHRRLAGATDPVTGGSLVALLRHAGFPRTHALAALGPDGRLRRERWLHATRQARGHEPIDTWFSATPAALSLFWSPGEADDAERPPAPRPYRDEEELLWDLLRWRNLCLARAESLFPADGSIGGPGPRFRQQRESARAALVELRRRLQITPGGREFRLERFRRGHRLGADQLLVAVHLLFSELIEGEPFISALECLRVIAENRTDLFAKRRTIGPNGRLRATGIVVAAEHPELAKALATDLSLADWAAEEMLAGIGLPPRFDAGEIDEFLNGDD